MHENIIHDRLIAIKEHIGIIERRMKGITKPSDFRTKAGGIMFDAILMRLQALGENIKKIDELRPGYLDETLVINVDNIIRFRDLISHHYEKMDSEIIYNIVREHIPVLKSAIKEHLKRTSVKAPDLGKANVQKSAKKP